METAAPAKKRRWFQIHLSTVVALTIVTGGIVGLNLIPTTLHDGPPESDGVCELYGWPMNSVVINSWKSKDYQETLFRVHVTDTMILRWYPLKQRYYNEWLVFVATEVSMWLGILVGTVVVSEVILRRRIRNAARATAATQNYFQNSKLPDHAGTCSRVGFGKTPESVLVDCACGLTGPPIVRMPSVMRSTRVAKRSNRGSCVTTKAALLPE